MNPWRGWNPDLEESYLLDYSEYEAETVKNGRSGFHLHFVNILDPDPSPISIYREIPNMTIFILLGFSSMKP